MFYCKLRNKNNKSWILKFWYIFLPTHYLLVRIDYIAALWRQRGKPIMKYRYSWGESM